MPSLIKKNNAKHGSIQTCSRITVCEVLCDLVDGGVESMLLNYLANMNLSRFNLHIITYSVTSDACKEKFAQLGCDVHIIPPKREGFVKSTLAMYDVMHHIQPDVVHAHLTDWNALAAVCARLCRVRRIIVHSHLSTRETPKYIHGGLCLLGKIAATDLIACSDLAAANMYGNNWDSNNKVLILNNAIELSAYRFKQSSRKKLREELGFGESQTIVGHIGRLTEQKNHPFLLRAFKKFKAEIDSNAILLLFGKGVDELRLKSLSLELGIADSVLFMGTTPDVADWYSAFDLFVLPSLYEGLPVSAIEAQANGLPTLLSCAITKQVAFNKNVMYCSIDSPCVWANEMCRCLKAGRVNCPDVPIEFDIQAQAMRLEEMYAK